MITFAFLENLKIEESKNYILIRTKFMSNDMLSSIPFWYVYLLLLALFIIYLLAKLIFKKAEQKRFEIVKGTSLMYSKISALNDMYFATIKKIHYDKLIAFDHNTKNSFDRDSPEEFMYRTIRENYDKYYNLVKDINRNKEAYEEYLKKYTQIKNYLGVSEVDVHILNPKLYQRYEERLYDMQLNEEPDSSVSFQSKVSYTSPQGRNSYTNAKYFHTTDIIDAVDRCKRELEWQQIIEGQYGYERRKMTPKLRLNIIERDQRKCTICGRGIKDGVKLHVDHIVPVSKGGKTIPENLRTLCEECNLGKSARILDGDNVNE